MKKMFLLILLGTFEATAAFSAFAQAATQKFAHISESQNSPIVYFTRDVSAEGLMKVYNALKQKKQGKVGIKVSFGAPDEDVLKPELLTQLIKATDGTMIDSCGLSGNRWTAEMDARDR